MRSTPLLTEKEAAARLHFAPKTLRKWRAQGSGPAYSKLGRAIRYSEQDLDDWDRSRRMVPGSLRPLAVAG